MNLENFPVGQRIKLKIFTFKIVFYVGGCSLNLQKWKRPK